MKVERSEMVGTCLTNDHGLPGMFLKQPLCRLAFRKLDFWWVYVPHRVHAAR